MINQDGKFFLFDAEEFSSWLNATPFSRVIRMIQNHHTWKPSYQDFRSTNHFDLLHGMERSHLERGFSEIAQNLTTFPDGTVAVCRPIDTIPAGIKGANKNGICVENLGNFDQGQDAMTTEHRNCILKVNVSLCKKFNLQPSPQTVVYHHWFDLVTGQRTNGGGTTKSCPGTQFFSGNSTGEAAYGFISLITQQIIAQPELKSGPPSTALYTAEVAADRLNVRALPSLSAAILKSLNRCVEVSVYEERGGWCRIDPVNSYWVDGKYLLPNVFPTKVMALYAAQVTAELLNVRSLPSSSGKVVGQLKKGTNAFVYQELDGWCRINPSSSMWVSGTHLARMYSTTA
jgi:hypothetical protein